MEEDTLKKLQDKIAVEKFKKIEKRKTKLENILQSTFMFAIFSLSITGIAFAQEISTKIYENKYGTGNGFGRAIEEGYIQKQEDEPLAANSVIENMETGRKIEDLETKVKVKDFTMDNYNLSISFEVELSSKAKEIISTEEIVEMNFPDLIISDENNNVLYCLDTEIFNNFCKEKNLSYNADTATAEQFINSGVGTFIESRDGNKINIVYAIYTGENSTYPKCKKLNIEMNNIKISKNETSFGDEEINLLGNWKFSLDVPEQIYNREEISYKQKSTENEKYELAKAIITETGTEIQLNTKLENVDYPDSSELSSEEQKFYNILYKSGENEELCTDEILNYLGALREYSPEIQAIREKQASFREKYYNVEWYITNNKGEKFETIQTNRETRGNSYNSQTGVLKLYGNFDLTKYDLTDEITLHIKHNGNDFEIILNKEGV